MKEERTDRVKYLRAANGLKLATIARREADGTEQVWVRLYAPGFSEVELTLTMLQQLSAMASADTWTGNAVCADHGAYAPTKETNWGCAACQPAPVPEEDRREAALLEKLDAKKNGDDLAF